MPIVPQRSNFLLPILSIKNLANRVNVKFVTPIITVCPIAALVEKPAALNMSVA